MTTSQTVFNGATSPPCLTNGANIIAALSVPKFWQNNTTTQNGFYSNSVTAVFRAINAPAVDQGLSLTSQQFAFQYQVTVEIMPSAEYAYVATNGAWLNLTAPTAIYATNYAEGPQDEAFAANLQNNLWDIRLTFGWPVSGNGQIGGGHQVFRSSVAGNYFYAQHNTAQDTAPIDHWFMQPLTYTAFQTP
jgi:hypothetical protein